MKKIGIFLIIIIVVITCIFYIYLNYKANYNEAQFENLKYDTYYQKEIKGTELTTIINRAVDSNTNNEIEKDENGKYIENGKDSIKIDIKMIDIDQTYDMETVYAGEMDEFTKYYGNIKFKCTQVKYHTLTKKIKYMLFEQISY